MIVRFARLVPFLAIRLFIVSFALVPAAAQDRFDPVTMGTARSGIATTRGIGALSTNPGALDYFPIHQTTLPQDLVFSLYSGGGTVGGTYLAGDEFSEIFGSLDGATNEQRERIGELLVDERLFANGGIDFLSGIWRTKDGGTFGLHYGSRLYARVNFPDDLANLIATSNITSQDFRFVNRGIGTAWITEFGLSYGKVLGNRTEKGWFPSIGLGLTANLLMGVAHFEVDENSAIYIDQINVRGQLRFLVRGGYHFRSAQPDDFDQVNAPGNFFTNPFPGMSGLGFGFDAGISGVLYRGDEQTVHYGFVLGNVGMVSWSNRTRERRALDFFDTLGASLTNQEFERFEGELVSIDGYSTALPSTFRAGLGLTLGDNDPETGKVTFGLEGEAPLNQVPGNTPDPRIAFGADWSLAKQFSLRAGLSAGGVGDVGLGFGFGLRPVDWLSIDLGTSELNAIFSGDRLDLAVRLAAGVRLE